MRKNRKADAVRHDNKEKLEVGPRSHLKSGGGEGGMGRGFKV